jgi:hypothetical protein
MLFKVRGETVTVTGSFIGLLECNQSAPSRLAPFIGG